MFHFLRSRIYTKNRFGKCKRATTKGMAMFPTTCDLFTTFTRWLSSIGGGDKGQLQAHQIGVKYMKYLKFALPDIPEDAEGVSDSLVNFCLGSPQILSSFVTHLQETWKLGLPGVLSYLNALCHALDHRRFLGLTQDTLQAFVMCEVYMQRVKRSVGKKMRLEWKTILSMEYLESINCWATLEELQAVVPFHTDRYNQALLNARHSTITEFQLAFCTSFVVTVLFLLVKGTRPMTYQYLTVDMILSIGEDGFVDQTQFKTAETYGYDTLMFSNDVLIFLKSYIKELRPLRSPKCPFVLVTRNGTQLTQLTEHLGNMVYQAIGKYIHPTRYRQILETESASKLSSEEQGVLPNYQKHSSVVAKMHYQKLQSRFVSESGVRCMEKLVDQKESREALKLIGLNLPEPPSKIDFSLQQKSTSQGNKGKSYQSQVEKTIISTDILVVEVVIAAVGKYSLVIRKYWTKLY